MPLGRARFTELSLLVWVATFAVTGFVAVLATESSSFNPTAVVVPVVFLALMLTLHVFLVSIRFRGDQILMPIAAGLTAIGLVLVQRLASDLLLQQLSWSIIAAGAFAATIVVPRDLTALARFKWTWALLGIILLIAPLLPVIGREINGARIWIKVGPGSIEPWEAVKILLVIFFAAYLEEYREVLSRSQRRIGPFPVPPVPYLVPIVAMWVIAMLVMVFEKDMGATVLFFGIFLAMLFLATGEAFYALMG
ncbi:MAG TPA: FtsW/RodA/SpoVE family cell cycle protein, partial [Candidatus Limnocylindria bacterium]|nr:FtsW/RodA/SpoVE family cell cycle protein [Candidatus Limnocylindria bacterium]